MKALLTMSVTQFVVIASALCFLCGGFRRPLPEGFSYVRTWASMPLLFAIPLLTVPEMLVLDFVLWNAPAWRTASDVVHVYAMLWCVGIAATARARPHRCEPDRVRLRFGCLRRLDLDRKNIARVSVRGSLEDPAARKRAVGLGGDVMVMTLSGVPAVELILHEPVAVRSLIGRVSAIRRVLVAVDEPAAFAKAIVAA
jgi:hypothetical protein